MERYKILVAKCIKLIISINIFFFFFKWRLIKKQKQRIIKKPLYTFAIYLNVVILHFMQGDLRIMMNLFS